MAFSILKRGRKADDGPTFKTRTGQFWDWYAVEAEHLRGAINSGEAVAIGATVSARVHEFMPGFGWHFGPGAGSDEHSFTLTAEGDAHRQLLTRHWKSRAPTIPDWTFHAWTQPKRNIQHAMMRLGGREVMLGDYAVAPEVDDEGEIVHVEAWHPAAHEMGHEQATLFLFHALDGVLGELGTEQWLGGIEMVPERPDGSMPIGDLPRFLADLAAKTGWIKSEPGELEVGYKPPETDVSFRRSDTTIGRTRHMKLIEQHFGSADRIEDPFPGLGAAFVWADIGLIHFPKGDEVAARRHVEDALEGALGSAGSGFVLGSAFSRTRAYIDVLIYDGQAALDAIENVLRERNVARGARIEPFVKSAWRARSLD